MQRGRAYAVAGVQQNNPGIRLNVQSHVRLPDSEAGGAEMPWQPYYAGQVAPAPRRHLTVPSRIAAVVLCVMAVVFGGLIISRMSRKAQLARDMTVMENAILQTMKDNQDLAVQVAEARDSARVCFLAVQNLGMIASTGVEPVLVVAQDTRPDQPRMTAQETSPYSAREGVIIGSR